jgi:hypothetical protein
MLLNFRVVGNSYLGITSGSPVIQDPATPGSERYCLFTAAVVQTVRPKQSLPRCSGRPHPVTNTSGIERQSLRGY